MALKTKNPFSTYREYLSEKDNAKEEIPIDQHPQKDWLRAT